MIDEIQPLMNQYWAWLRDKTVLKQVGNWLEITTPYLDRHNDSLQVYARRTDNGYELTDDGYIIQDLQISGYDLKSRKRRDLLQMTLRGFGVQQEGDALVVQATSDNFAPKKHNLVQAMLAVNDLFYMAAPNVANLFFEDVVVWLGNSQIRYTPKVKFTGKSGYDHMFDFVIPKSPLHQAPERILKTINMPTRDTAQSVVFSWIDTRDTREPDSRIYVILNDSEREPAPNVISAFRNYDVHPIPWSDRESVLEELAA
jgi:Domain of unknown function DUF1829/Domain of unknown function DUF1828